MNATRRGLVPDFRSLISAQPRSAAAICKELAITQPTFSRLWKEAGPDVISLGAARATVYGIKREIADIGSEAPVFRMNVHGRIAPFGQLRFLQNQWFAFIPEGTTVPQLSHGLPYFMQDMRPQGFLGRLVPRHHTDLMLPESITEWSDDDVLRYLIRRGDDVSGDLVVGNESYLRLLDVRTTLSADTSVPQALRSAKYPYLAMQANQGEIVGSSAGGEQPKFITAVHTRNDTTHVIVKFSPTTDVPSGRRWADLLVAEHLAAQTLSDHGIQGCRSEILFAEGRCFLEVERFDRTGDYGRLPMVSLSGIDCLLGMADKPWSVTAATLSDKGLLSARDLEKIRIADVFGALIGNTDRHPGNLSLSWSDGGTFTLLPVYDMLPMVYRPNTQGEVVDRAFSPTGLAALDLRFLGAAAVIATDFWPRVLQDERISSDFKAIAVRHMAATKAYGVRLPTTEPELDEEASSKHP